MSSLASLACVVLLIAYRSTSGSTVATRNDVILSETTVGMYTPSTDQDAFNSSHNLSLFQTFTGSTWQGISMTTSLSPDMLTAPPGGGPTTELTDPVTRDPSTTIRLVDSQQRTNSPYPEGAAGYTPTTSKPEETTRVQEMTSANLDWFSIEPMTMTEARASFAEEITQMGTSPRARERLDSVQTSYADSSITALTADTGTSDQHLDTYDVTSRPGARTTVTDMRTSGTETQVNNVTSVSIPNTSQQLIQSDSPRQASLTSIGISGHPGSTLQNHVTETTRHHHTEYVASNITRSVTSVRNQPLSLAIDHSDYVTSATEHRSTTEMSSFLPLEGTSTDASLTTAYLDETTENKNRWSFTEFETSHGVLFTLTGMSVDQFSSVERAVRLVLVDLVNTFCKEEDNLSTCCPGAVSRRMNRKHQTYTNVTYLHISEGFPRHVTDNVTEAVYVCSTTNHNDLCASVQDLSCDTDSSHSPEIVVSLPGHLFESILIRTSSRQRIISTITEVYPLMNFSIAVTSVSEVMFQKMAKTIKDKQGDMKSWVILIIILSVGFTVISLGLLTVMLIKRPSKVLAMNATA